VPARIDNLQDLRPAAPSTRLGDSLKQLSEQTSDLPIGAVVLLSDGGDNTGGIDADAISALRARHIPVHTVASDASAPNMTWSWMMPWLLRAPSPIPA
jgi:hypothetical protein